ncbi:GIY-YIG nuclease family protein [Rhodohalobacter halophilus]|uniref:GIY-YIG nuclease family protein n=1 Tax=Rhodohalobacter halophilus TaxID=1812810 RepID=UPI00083F9E76
MFYTYILYSLSKDGYYIGYTSSTPQDRLNRHNNGMTHSTKSGIPWTIVFSKSFDDKSDAFRFENLIKRQKSRKFLERLINSDENECNF